jgi:hypothetical protein
MLERESLIAIATLALGRRQPVMASVTRLSYGN